MAIAAHGLDVGHSYLRTLHYGIERALALGFPPRRKPDKIVTRRFDRQRRTTFLFKMLKITNDRVMHSRALGELLS